MNQKTTMQTTEAVQIVHVGNRSLRIEDVLAVAEGRAQLALSHDPAFRARIDAGARHLERMLAETSHIYGVTTGYGDSCTVEIPPELVAELPLHLTRYHGCGLGDDLDQEATLAVMTARLTSLSVGFSGVRSVLLERIAFYANQRILPRIPAEGSVGASGDLTPLSYLAAALVGERDVVYRGTTQSASAVLEQLNLTPLQLAPKEGLAIMNGTAVMTGLACLAFARADYLSRVATRLTALSSWALLGNSHHFDARLFEAKPHQGQNECAAWIRGDLEHLTHDQDPARLQDRYSIRCAPHVIGVLRDALPWLRRDIENELNSANDNPLIDPDTGAVMHGGHFYGGHIAFAMDALKVAVANLADLMDRQLALLVDTRYNAGLPQNLSGTQGARAPINHGFKAVQIGVSAWTAEALKLTMPASVFSRSTECHNQDKVSMGTIAARDCLRVLELVEQVTAAHCLAVNQAVTLRLREQAAQDASFGPVLDAFRNAIHALSPFVDEDRPLEHELRALMAAIRSRHLPAPG
ncbi:MAG: aromatic amino acid lyase [Burkholderiaceae bacterium]|nr:MAG: aromatic amino acid lyase [Burkholderiaceae bacterium]